MKEKGKIQEVKQKINEYLEGKPMIFTFVLVHFKNVD